jgi:hypothetical protein
MSGSLSELLSMVATGPDSGRCRYNLIEDRFLLYLLAHTNFLACLGSCLGRYHEWVSFLAKFHSYLEIPMKW